MVCAQGDAEDEVMDEGESVSMGGVEEEEEEEDDDMEVEDEEDYEPVKVPDFVSYNIYMYLRTCCDTLAVPLL